MSSPIANLLLHLDIAWLPGLGEMKQEAHLLQFFPRRHPTFKPIMPKSIVACCEAWQNPLGRSHSRHFVRVLRKCKNWFQIDLSKFLMKPLWIGRVAKDIKIRICVHIPSFLLPRWWAET